MERIPITRRTGEILLAISLVVIAGILFLRRMLTDEFANLPAGEVALWSAVFAALAAFAASRLSPLLPASTPAQMSLSLALLFGVAFTAGLAADPLDAFAGIFAVVAAIALPFLADFARASLDSGNRTGMRENLAERDPTPDSRLPIPDDDDVSQTLTRRMIGNDCHVEGMIAFEIPPGELVHQLHVPFWPALPAAPIVECEIDDCEARVRVPLAAAHGLRIEVRASEPSEETRSGVLHFTAHASAARAAA